MAVIERGVTYTCRKTFSGAGKFSAGFDYTIINTEEDAKARNVDVIRVEPFTMKTGSTSVFDHSWQNVTFKVEYGGSSFRESIFTRRYDASYGSANQKYYFIQTSNGSWSGSNPTQNAISRDGVYVNGYLHYNQLDYLGTHGSNYGLILEIPHNDDGTPKSSITITLGSNASYGYGSSSYSCKPVETFELSKIDRGTRVYRYNGSTWEKSALVHVQGEATGAQHYIYKYNGSSWVKYYG